MTKKPTTSALTTEEQERRQDSVRYAIASTRISGLPITPDTEALLDAWVRGEMSSDELIERAIDFGQSSDDKEPD